MKIQQAIFTSSDRGQIKGYQLVAMSDGIDRGISKELYRWSPSHMGNDDPTHWTINYFPVSKDCVAVARTVLGGPEYSGRGGLQVVTLIAVLHNEQFATYGNNAILVAQTALALGWLRLPTGMPHRLEAFELPDHPVELPPGNQRLRKKGVAENDSPTWGPASKDFDDDDSEFRLLSEVIELLKENNRLAIIGARSPVEMAAKLISHLSPESRREFSFTTGLPPAPHRPFQAHFLAYSNRALDQMFKSDCVTVVKGQPIA